MSETSDEENARLLGPYERQRNATAAECLLAMLEGRHAEAASLFERFALENMAYESAVQICTAFDLGNVTITDTSVEIDIDAGHSHDKGID